MGPQMWEHAQPLTRSALIQSSQRWEVTLDDSFKAATPPVRVYRAYRPTPPLPHENAAHRKEGDALAEMLLTIMKQSETAGLQGGDAVPPTEAATLRACRWAVELFALAPNWLRPLISDSGDGGLMFEWWKGKKKITVYVSGESIEYIKVWGPDMIHEMEEGSAQPISDFMQVWTWLTQE